MQRYFISVLLLAVGCTPGQRLLTVEVRVDDEVRFEGIRGVVDSTPVPDMWNIVPDVPLAAVDNVPGGWKPDNDSECDLTGNVSVRILHGTHELTRADMESVSLKRRPTGWFLAESTVPEDDN